MKSISKIGILTSGGDAPGMNAAIRSVVRTGIAHGMQIVGIVNGYQGLLDGSFLNLKAQDVANIIQRGGTMLKTARCEEFTQPEGRAQAAEMMTQEGIDALVVVGGDGTFKGAKALSEEYNVPVMGIPGTIDNDIAGSNYTIGFDTAANTAVEAIDKIRDTASAHNRVFVVEVMGRKSGLIALHSGVSCGAEDILIPEQFTNFEHLLDEINYDKRRNKRMRIIVVCEGDDFGGAVIVSENVKKRFPNLDVKTTILGHIQRGGSPSHYDRWMASRFGYEAVLALLRGQQHHFIGFENGQMKAQSLFENYSKNIEHTELLKMAKILSI